MAKGVMDGAAGDGDDEGEEVEDVERKPMAIIR